MLPRTRSNFSLGEESHDSKKKKSIIGDLENPKKSSVDPVGLRILIQSSRCESNIVIKPAFIRSIRPTAPTRRIPAICEEPSFLKACYLCKKRLSPGKDVYMYRGDQGFCSVECRCRQIFLDEMKEIEASTKAMLASSRQCRSNGRVHSGRRRDIPAAA